MDVGKITAMVLLDLSSAFDTEDHNILLNELAFSHNMCKPKHAYQNIYKFNKLNLHTK